MLRSESVEWVGGEAHDAPRGEHVCAYLFVDGDSGCVPVEHVPLEARAAFVDGDAGEAREESFADSLPAKGGRDVKVFKADAVVAAPGGVAGEVESETGGGEFVFFRELGDEGAEADGRGGRERRDGVGCEQEAIAEEIGCGGDHCVWLALEGGELVDEAQHGRDVGGGGGADGKHRQDG